MQFESEKSARLATVARLSLKCSFCDHTYSSSSARSRHTRKSHPEAMKDRKHHIRCPICPGEETFIFHRNLIQHLNDVHIIITKELVLSFQDLVAFEEWRALDNREVDYAISARHKLPNGDERIFYECNRSDFRGFVSTCSVRNIKKEGTIRIKGTCPSRMVVTISKNGAVMIKFVETHVGHTDEVRSKRLTTTEEAIIVDKLLVGVPTKRIIQDGRQACTSSNNPGRSNLLTRGDISYLLRKYNIDKTRHQDDMIATSLKVKEWNRNGKSHAFLFKNIGESYPGLHDNDFAVAYMNSTMERKLREHSRIICIDGTHGTNRRNYELTTILVKDENNMGFPVAFLLSNRMDQTIQEIFVKALRLRLGESIESEYVMSDDDPKYYNAWTQIMKTDNTPRRLLCSWHVIKNWNTKGKSKIKNAEIKKDMKMKMREIITETDINQFMQKKEEYFQQLQIEGENDFLKYLQNYYFQNEERIMMWAHCYRINAGINTNMAIESLNRVLKYNKLSGNCNIRVEKLLDMLEELVEEKMWKTITDTERPNANNYHHKIIVEAHKKAEQLENKVHMVECGKFEVQSGSENGKYYCVVFNGVCDEACRLGYCNVCKICFHKYKCPCPENSVKTVLCKHIHAVALFEEKSDYVLDTPTDSEGEIFKIDTPSIKKLKYESDRRQFMEEQQHCKVTVSCDAQKRKELGLEEIHRIGQGLDGSAFDRFLAICRQFKENTDVSKKRKMEKQTYFPNTKHK